MGRLREIARAWAATTALLLGGLLLPIGGVALLVAVPQPALRLEASQGARALAAMVSLVTVGVAASLGGSAAALYFAGFGVPSLALPYFVRTSRSIEAAVGWTSALGFIALAGTLVAVGAEPTALASSLRGGLEEGRQHLVALYRHGGVAQDLVDQVEKASGGVVDAVVRLAPALALVGIGAVVLLNVLLFRWRRRSLGLSVPFGDLTRWKIPAGWVWALIASGYGLFLPWPAIRSFAENALAVVVAAYFCQGFAIVHFYFQRWHSPFWMRSLLYVFLSFEWLLASLVVLLGVFDLWGDFRRLSPRPVEEE